MTWICMFIPFYLSSPSVKETSCCRENTKVKLSCEQLYTCIKPSDTNTITVNTCPHLKHRYYYSEHLSTPDTQILLHWTPVHTWHTDTITVNTCTHLTHRYYYIEHLSTPDTQILLQRTPVHTWHTDTITVNTCPHLTHRYYYSEHLSTPDTQIQLQWTPVRTWHRKGMIIQSYVQKATQQSYSYSSLAEAPVRTKHTLLLPFQYKVANAWRPIYLLIFLVAYSEIRTTDFDRLHWTLISI